jgi:hypothetical protein
MWVVTCEIVVPKGELRSGYTNAFVNVVTWAGTGTVAEKKAFHCLESCGWKVIATEACRPVNEQRIYDDDIAEIIDQVRGNPDAVIYGRIFSYKAE